MISHPEAAAPGLDANEADLCVRQKGSEYPDGVRAAANARHHRMWEARMRVFNLHECFIAYHALELPYHARIGVRAKCASEQVIRIADVGDPIAQGLVDGIL